MDDALFEFREPAGPSGHEFGKPRPRPAIGALRVTARSKADRDDEARAKRADRSPNSIVAEQDGMSASPQCANAPTNPVPKSVYRPIRYPYEFERSPWRLPASVIFDAPPATGILHRNDGQVLAYGGVVNNMVSHAGGGKTWVALLQVFEVLSMGGRVCWHNLDSGRLDLKDRFTMLGLRDAVSDGEVFSYTEDLTELRQLADAALWLSEAVRAGKPALYVIDTLERAGCPPDGASIAEWWDFHLAPFERAEGVTVTCLDHLPRYTEGRGGAGGSGSQAKGARITGLGLRTQGPVWTRTENGHVDLYIDKDRLGAAGRPGEHIATVFGRHGSDGAFEWEIAPPRQHDAQTATAQILAAVEADPGITTNKLITQVQAGGVSEKQARGTRERLIGSRQITIRAGANRRQHHHPRHG